MNSGVGGLRGVRLAAIDSPAAGLSNHDRGRRSERPERRTRLPPERTGEKLTYDGDGAVAASPGWLGASNMVNWVEYLDSKVPGADGTYYNVVEATGASTRTCGATTKGHDRGQCAA